MKFINSKLVAAEQSRAKMRRGRRSGDGRRSKVKSRRRKEENKRHSLRGRGEEEIQSCRKRRRRIQTALAAEKLRRK
jgi:hypothetical protein